MTRMCADRRRWKGKKYLEDLLLVLGLRHPRAVTESNARPMVNSLLRLYS